MTAVILNLAACGGRAGRRWEAIERLLAEGIGAVNVHATAGPGHATMLAREVCAQGCDRVIAAGGDGTLHEVVNGLSSDVPLGILPIGSGRDFARALGVRDARHAVAVIARSRVRTIDLMRAQFRDASGTSRERRCLNMASVGLGAIAAQGAEHRHRWAPAPVRYMVAALPALAGSAGTVVRLSIEETTHEFRITTLAIANGRYQGGGILMAPTAALDDGLLDITLIESVSLAELAANIRLLYSGAIYSHPKVRHWRTSSVHVESDFPVLVELDGEVVGTLPLEAEVLPGALKVLSP